MSACPERQVTGAEYLVFEELPYASPEDLRRTFRRHASGVAVITTNGTSGPVGFTVTSLVSVSADPPRVSFNLAHTASSWPAASLARTSGSICSAPSRPTWRPPWPAATPTGSRFRRLA